MAIAFVQAASTLTAKSVVFSTALTATNTVVMVVLTSATTINTTTVTDTGSNTYSTIPTSILHNSNHDLQMLYAPIVTGGGTTLTITSTAANCVAIAQEFTGLTSTPFDVATGWFSQASTSAPASGATATTAQADELVVGGLALTTTPTIAAGTGYSNLTTALWSAFTQPIAMESQVISATGTPNAAFALGAAAKTNSFTATFKGASVAAAAPFGEIVQLNQAVTRAANY